MSVKNLSVTDEKKLVRLDNVSFDIHSGEILGIAGVSGNGQKELAEVISGMIMPSQGSVELRGRDVTHLGAKKKFEAGIGFIPEDRLGTGLVSSMDLGDNLILKDYSTPASSRAGFIKYSELPERARKAVKEFSISVADIKAPVRLMSGGNLQKVLLAREIDADPQVLVAAYPARGLDYAASAFVFEKLERLKLEGCGILLIAEDLDSIFRYCDRVMVMYRGKVMGICDTDKTNITDIGMMMMGTPLEEVRRYEEYGHF